MKQFKAEWVTHHANSVEEDHNQTINHLINQHNALCDYLEESGCGLTHCDHLNCHTFSETPLFKADSIELIEWKNGLVGMYIRPFVTKAQAEQAREALLKLTE